MLLQPCNYCAKLKDSLTQSTAIRCKLDGKQGGLDMYPAGLSLTFSLETLQELGHLPPGIQMDTSHTKGTGKMATWLSLGDL
jgi:hypothetical protein